AYWFALYPPMETTLAQARAFAVHKEALMGVLSVAAYLTLAWQLAFPLFAWRPRGRLILLGGALVGWLGLTFGLGAPLMGAAIFVCCLSYLPGPLWRRLVSPLAGVPILDVLARSLFALPSRPSERNVTGQRPASLVPMGQRS